MAGRAKRNTSPAEWLTFGGLCLLATLAALAVGELAPRLVPRRGPTATPPPAANADTSDLSSTADADAAPPSAALRPPLLLLGPLLQPPLTDALTRLQSVLKRSHNITVDGSALFLEAGEVLSRRWLSEDGRRLVAVRYRVQPQSSSTDAHVIALTVDVMQRDLSGTPWARATPKPLESLSLRVDPETLAQAVEVAEVGAGVVAVRFPARGACRGEDVRIARTTFLRVGDAPARLLSVISEGAKAHDPRDTARLSLRWVALSGDEGEGEVTLQRRLDGLTARRSAPDQVTLTASRRAALIDAHLVAGDPVEVEAHAGAGAEVPRWQAQVVAVGAGQLTLAVGADGPADGAEVRLLLPPHRFGFRHGRDGFRVWPDRLLPSLDGHPALWSLEEDALTRAERALSSDPSANLSADTVAQASADALASRYGRLVEGLAWVGDIDGSPPYCVETPHRVQLADGIDPYAWQSDLSKRLSRLRLSRALLIAQAGDGPRALSVLSEPEPLRALSGSLRGEQLLRALRGQPPSAALGPASSGGPQLKDLRYDTARPYLRPAPTLARPALRPQPLPLRWREEGVLTLSLPQPLPQAARALSMTLLAQHARAAFPAPHPHPHARAGQVIAAALATPARAAARALLYSAAEEVLDLRAPGAPARATALTASLRAESPWLTRPLDASPSQTSLLLDWGMTCDGWAVITCKGVADTCANPAALGLKPDAFAQNLMTARAHPWLVVTTLPLPARPPTCGPDGQPLSLDAAPHLLGWLDERRWLLTDHRALWAGPSPLTPLSAADLAALPDAARWLHVFGGDQRRFTPHLNRDGIWLWDHKRQRDTLLEWWQSRDIGLSPPAPNRGLVALSPRGQWLAVWSEGHGLMIGRVTQLPP